MHRVKDSSVDRLKSVFDVGKSPGNDNAHCTIEVTLREFRSYFRSLYLTYICHTKKVRLISLSNILPFWDPLNKGKRAIFRLVFPVFPREKTLCRNVRRRRS